MSITKYIDGLESRHNTCKDNLYDAQEHIVELEKALSESERISKSWKVQWENVLHENALLKKDNERIKELEEELTLDEETMGEFNVNEGRLNDEITRLRIAMDYLLRSPAGLVPREADWFYDGERATFQTEDE